MTRKLVTNEEAIKCLTVELGLRTEGYHSYLSHYGKQDKAEEEFLDSLQTAIAALREQPQWISVEEKLPEVGQMVLVYCRSQMYKKHITVSTYTADYSYTRRCYWSRRIKNVTHWMPLPEMPKEET